MKKFLYFLFFIFSTPLWATELKMDVAVLRGLDKVTGRISTFSIPVGKVGYFGKMFIVPEACYTRPPEEFPENSVFLYVFEKSLKGENIEMFKGWMFSSNPALSSMEHPVYDIWVIGCEKKEEEQVVQSPSDTADKLQTVIETSKTENLNSVLPTESVDSFLPSAVEMEEL